MTTFKPDLTLSFEESLDLIDQSLERLRREERTGDYIDLKVLSGLASELDHEVDQTWDAIEQDTCGECSESLAECGCDTDEDPEPTDE